MGIGEGGDVDHRQGAGTDRRTGPRLPVTASVGAVPCGDRHPVMRRPGRRLLLAATAAMLLLGACAGRDPAPFVAELDGLALPSTWQVAQTDVRSQGGDSGCIELINPDCPRITRYYLVSGELRDILEEARQALVSHGFVNSEVVYPNCDSALSGSKCFFNAAKTGMEVSVNLYAPGEVVDHLGMPTSDMATVRITINRH